MRQTDIKNEPGTSSGKNKTVIVFALIIGISFAIYAIKLFSLQIIEGSVYRQQSENISQRSKKIPAQRGEIFDRNATLPMVINVDSFAVDIIPGEIPSDRFDTVIARLATILSVPKKDIDKKLASTSRRSFSAIEIKSNVTYNTISAIAEDLSELPGVSWRAKPLRNYVETGSISHILGYVGDITKDELKVLYNKGYTSTSIIGKAGVEKQYDLILRGTEGSERRIVDVRGRYMAEPAIIDPPEMGKNLVLTIDKDIQILAEKALGNRIGAAVVLKPASGEVLAMVSYPYFDPNAFGKEENAYGKLANDSMKPLLNRAINASYPPASTFKLVMAAAVLAENSLAPTKTIECVGEIYYGDRLFRCHIRKPGHGYVDLRNGLAQSCNIYFWTAGRDYLGVDRIASYAREFGFGLPIKIDLPGQTEGFVPTPQWKERRFHEKWLGGDTMSMSIGQGYLLTSPMQVANMVAMIANKGVVYEPHVLKEIRNPATNEVISEVAPKKLLSSTMPESVWKMLQEDMRYTVANGSAQFPLRNKVVQIAGKTGTGEIAGTNERWHSWFASYGPYDAPIEDAVVVVVLVEAINEWEWWAPYASNIIYQGIFAQQSYEEAVQTLGFKSIVKPVGRVE